MSVITGNVTLTAGFTEQVTAGVVTTQNLPATVTQQVSYANGTAANQCDLIHAVKYTLAASATTIDLTAVPDLAGATINFARVREILCWISDTTLSHTVALGNAAATPFAAFWGATGIQTVYPGGAVYRWADPTSTGAGVGAVVSGTSKSLKLDPGSNTVVLNLIILGCSAA